MPDGLLSVRHYRAVHHHLFQDVYPWAGKSRTVRISKDGSAFCYPEYIDSQLKQTFARLRDNG
ncbi:Fic family protein [Bradyrhizobium sp. C-145]|uniref:Fic family protein n=1 Tax=Bradyrhizobium sp. C-145 TaxID=574727 RepID=UPI00201B6877|nr:Fic family protein [Bradyrhizobium sp. C-145]UQR61366.1 Fic family protein [Bradyrhizobium sp. C-145]